uniref:Adenylate kinase putative n=1 Tax=Albugo laibachii Nc14 TaxID=890382 RepID=F0WC21_9STRA|nr:adenylate kinase putative [Albugo laibachii Nc14]|eukprot:CCA18702.1 adenylate kinase putative [Albugo laibachii Nc14]
MESIHIRKYDESDIPAVETLDAPVQGKYCQIFGVSPQEAPKTSSILLVAVQTSCDQSEEKVIAFMALSNQFFKAQQVLPSYCEIQAHLTHNEPMQQMLGQGTCLIMTSFAQCADWSHCNVVTSFFHHLFHLQASLQQITLPTSAVIDLEKLNVFPHCFTSRESIISSFGAHLYLYHADRAQYCTNMQDLMIHRAESLTTDADQLIHIQDLLQQKDSAYELQPYNMTSFKSLLEQVERDDHQACFVAHRVDNVENISETIGVACTTDDFNHLPLDAYAHANMYAKMFGGMYREWVHSKKPQQAFSLEKKAISPLTIIMCGPPASGKGTQCERLAKEFGLVYLSTEDILRSHAQYGTHIGQRIQIFVDAGEVVPEHLIVRVLADRMKREDCRTRGWILDGFPKTQKQANALLAAKIIPDILVILDLPENEVVDRVLGGRIDPHTGKRYHLTLDPPPASIACRVVHLTDDSVITIRRRLIRYNETCLTIQAAYSKLQVETISVSAMESPAQVSNRIIKEVYRVKQWLHPLRVQCPPKVIIAGPPAGGKGTQCERLVRAYGVVHVSTGDILRNAIHNDLPIGLKAKSYMDAGQLVPDDIMNDLILLRLQDEDCQQYGWLLDGFPRTGPQAQALLEHEIIPDAMLVLQVPDEQVIARISGRLIDPITQFSYHKEMNPPPGDIQSRCITRDDDTPEVVRVRLEAYHANSSNVLDVLRPVCDIIPQDGTNEMNAIASHFIAAIEWQLIRHNCIAISHFSIQSAYEKQYQQSIDRFLACIFDHYPQRDCILLCLPQEIEKALLATSFTKFRKITVSELEQSSLHDEILFAHAPEHAEAPRNGAKLSSLYQAIRKQVIRRTSPTRTSLQVSLSPQETVSEDSAESILRTSSVESVNSDASKRSSTDSASNKKSLSKRFGSFIKLKKARPGCSGNDPASKKLSTPKSPSESLILYAFHRNDVPFLCSGVSVNGMITSTNKKQCLQGKAKGARLKGMWNIKTKRLACR